MSLRCTENGPTLWGKEKRQGQRVAAELLTQCEDWSGGGSFLGRTVDLGLSGLLMKSSNLLNRGTRVTVRFNLPPGPPGIHVEASGVVVRSQPEDRMGIQLLDLNESSQSALEEFVQQALGFGVGRHPCGTN